VINLRLSVNIELENDSYLEKLIEIEENINTYKIKVPSSKVDLNSDIWYLTQSFTNYKLKIDFNSLSTLLKNYEKKDALIFDVKYWMSDMLNTYSTNTLVNYFNGILLMIEGTDILRNFEEGYLIEHLKDMNFNNRKYFLSSGISFLYKTNDEVDNDNLDKAEILLEISNSFNIQNNLPRILPSNKDIIIFSKILEDFFNRDLEEIVFKRWFPIWLWWNLTSIIPMRITEFCILKKNCVYKVGDEYFIKIERIKSGIGTQTFPVSNLVVDNIKKYKKLVDYKGDLLFDTGNLPVYNTNGKFLGIKNNEDEFNEFNRGMFAKLIKSFYEKIVALEYNLYSSENGNDSIIKRRLRGGDTRHLAFINLKRQGFHPKEIAHIGGHLKLNSQEFYFRHLNQFVDLEITKRLIDIDIKSLYGETNEFVINDLADMDFVNNHILKPVEGDYKEKLELGYCTDSNMDCKVRSCLYCDYWRITVAEFIQNKDKINKELNRSYNEINKVLEEMGEIYKTIYKKTIDQEVIYPEKYMLNSKSNKLDSIINQYVNLAKLKERVI